MIPDNLEIVIVANKRKETITTKFLKDIPYRIFYTTDYSLPNNFKVEPIYLKYKSACRHKLGAYRCFRGHQDAITSCTKENILVFEDDASVDNDKWIGVINPAISLLDNFDIVSLHGRKFDRNKFNEEKRGDFSFYSKKDFVKNNDNYVLGALAYIVKNSFVKKIENILYRGNPWDLFICNDFKFCFLDPSPFIHDRQKGSLIEGRLIL